MMNNYPQRKSPRLQGYDYSQYGAYFVTICTYDRSQLFGSITDGIMQHNELGRIATACWVTIPDHFSSVELDVSIVMPNHIHGIIVLHGGDVTLGTVIGTYKAAVTRHSRRAYVGTPYMASVQDVPSARNMTCPPGKIWQQRYHDHVIRNEQSLQHIQEYILNNPRRWHEDIFYTA